jgi:6-phosphogluconolactonase
MIESFPTPSAAADAAAEAIAAQLRRPGLRSLLVTGGSGPGPVYDRLAGMDLDWPQVRVTLSDDRFTDEDDPLSNERMVRERLLWGHAAEAPFVPLRQPASVTLRLAKAAGLDAEAAAAETAIRDLSPFDAALLGMGPDGHIASLYSTNADAAQWLDPNCRRWVVGVRSAGWTPYVPRITLTARPLFDAKLIVLLISGDAKRILIEQIEADPVFSPPAAALLRQTKSPVRVIWSPD